MATGWNDSMCSLANKALALLRQDIALTSTNIDATSVGIKCKNLVPMAIDEFASIHKWTEDDKKSGDYEAALAYHIASVLAIPITGRQEDHKMFSELAIAKARAVRVRSLNVLLSNSEDRVLLALVQNFKIDDPMLATAWDVYKSRAESVKDGAKREIWGSHQWAFSSDDWGNAGASDIESPVCLAYEAFVELCVSKLAIPCGLGAEVAKLWADKSLATLEKARAKDLLWQARNVKVGDESKEDVDRILSLVRSIYDPGDKAKPLDIKELTDRIDIFMEPARKEVVSSYGWNFMRKEKVNPPCSGGSDGRWISTIPGDAVKVLGCFDCFGDKIEYTIHGNKIVAYAPIHRILYTADTEEPISEYPTLIRDAIILKVAERVATGLVRSSYGGSVDLAKLKSLKMDYETAVQTARTNDVKQVGVGERAWGRNYIVDIMLGKRRGKWGRPIW